MSLGPRDVVAVADGQREGQPALLVGGDDLDLVGEQRGVGDEDALVVIGPQHRGAHPDVLDRALVRAAPDLVADDEGAGQQDQDAGEQVLQHVAEGKADGHAADAQQVEQVGSRDRGEGHRGGDQEHHQDRDAAGDAAEHGSRAGGGLPQRCRPAHRRAHAAGDQQAHTKQHESNHQPRQQGGG